MSQEIILDNNLQTNKNLVWGLYLAHAATFLFTLGALSIIPVIINYLKREETAGSFLYSHHTWQLRSFWWYLGWMVLGFVLLVSIIGIPLAWLVFGGAWIWKAYRLIRGFIDLNADKAMPV